MHVYLNTNEYKNPLYIKKATFNECCFSYSRGGRIRTYDLLVPNEARYRATLHPENFYYLDILLSNSCGERGIIHTHNSCAIPLVKFLFRTLLVLIPCLTINVFRILLLLRTISFKKNFLRREGDSNPRYALTRTHV